MGDWGDFYYGRSCPKWSVTEDATIPCIRYGELYTKFGAKIDRVYSYTNMPPENLRFSKGTEVLIPRVGEDPMDYNHCTWLSMKDVAIGEMISVFNTDNNPLFTATMFNATLQNEFAMRVEGGSVTNLYFEKLKNIDVSFPSIREQEMIAAYFENIDNLITLHQRKSFLYFSRINDWEQRKLNEVAEFNPKSELPDEFEYVDLESVVGTEMISHRTETKDSAPSRAQRLAQPGDVFFQTVRPYQKNNYLFSKLDNNYVFSTGYAQMRPNIDTAFLMSFLQTDSFVKIVLDNCTGTSYPAINSSDLSNLEISLPKSFEEQKKVGKTIISIDNLITLHQRKCDETKKLKKFMLQKMFPKKDAKKPEIRFAGFTNDWEQRKFGDVGSVAMCKRIFKEQTSDEGEVPFYKIGTFGGEPDAFISRKLFDEYKTKYPYPHKGDILISASGSIGRTIEFTGKDEYFQDSNIVWLKHENEIDNNFLKVLYSIVEWSCEGSTIKRLYNDNFLKTEFMLPQIDEQIKLGDYFANLDNLITLHRRAYYNKKGGLTNVHNDNQQYYAIL